MFALPPRDTVPVSLKSKLILLALWACIVVALVLFRRVLLPFAIALVIAYLLEPVVTRMSRWQLRGRRLPRWAAVIALYAAFFLGLYLFSITVVPQLYRELAGLSKEGVRFFNSLTPERIGEFSDRVEQWLLSRGIPVELSGDRSDPAAAAYGLNFDLERSLRQGLAHLSQVLRAHFFDAVGMLQKLVGRVAGSIFTFFFVLMVAAFLLIDWGRIGRFFASLVPADRQQNLGELARAIDEKLSGVVRGQAVICLVNGTLTGIGLVIFDVPFVFVLSLVATVLSAVPIFGTIISSIPIVLMALTQGFHAGIGMLLWIIGIHALEAYLLNPKIMGSHAHIHPVIVAFALLAGESTFGFVGALFAVPVAGILIAVFNSLHERVLHPAGGPVAAPVAPRDEEPTAAPPAS
jgi:predicted PurR-regulated permease PerM